jgi:hypothetical protein
MTARSLYTDHRPLAHRASRSGTLPSIVPDTAPSCAASGGSCMHPPRRDIATTGALVKERQRPHRARALPTIRLRVRRWPLSGAAVLAVPPLLSRLRRRPSARPSHVCRCPSSPLPPPAPSSPRA